MKDERYKEIMHDLGMPNSRSLLTALQQVSHEAKQEVQNKMWEDPRIRTLIFLPIKITGGEANGPYAIYCSDCEHMQETMTNCGPATICTHPLIRQVGLRAFKESICTLDKERYLPKLTSFGKLVYLIRSVLRIRKDEKNTYRL